MGRAAKWLLLAAGVLVELGASLSLKAALEHPAWYVCVAVGYVLSFTLFYLALKRGLPLGVGYGIWGALGITLTALVSAALFGEPLTPGMLVGIAIAITGVMLVQIGSQLASRKVEAK